MLNHPILRFARKHGAFSNKYPHIPYFWSLTGIFVAFWVAFVLLMSGCAQASITSDKWESLRLLHQGVSEEKAVQAIIGEAESESYIGMLAIAHAIRNRAHDYHFRDVFKGIYGVNSKRVQDHLYSQQTWDLARLAWKKSFSQPDMTHGATGWGNAGDIAQFKRKGWFKNCVITAHIGKHYFYREVRHG